MDCGGDEFFSEHTISMRKAFEHCNGIFQNMPKEARLQSKRVNVNFEEKKRLIDEARTSALSVPQQRHEKLCQFWARQNSLHSNKKNSSTAVADIKLDVIDISSTEVTPLSGLEFRKQFQIGNIPCLIRGMDKSSYFSYICSQWRASGSNPKEPRSISINRDWFHRKLGEMHVPVRFQPSSSGGPALDDQGRAVECETKQMALHDWTDLLDQSHQMQSTCQSNYYLKDWHLQSLLRKSAEGTSSDHLDNPTLPLYEVPPYFQYDLLNSFLTKFTDSGDYFFTYWGPRGSRTTMHSDVLNSFSWSFNVSGTKEWKFFPPTLDCSQNEASPDPLVVIQHAGECIFVACGWRHEVANLEETLSINHNWLTTSNIDSVWDCLCSEMKAIDVELEAWDMGDDCWDAKESMLRGCAGMDVTGFFFMVLGRLLETLQDQPPSFEGADDNEDSVWQRHFDLVRLQQTLLALLKKEKLALQDRLAAVLCSESSAEKAKEIAEYSIATVDSMHKTSHN